MPLSKWCSVIVIAANALYFSPLTFEIIQTDGGDMGIGLLLLPVLIPINLMLIPAILIWRQSNKNRNLLMVLNYIGPVLCALGYWFLHL